MLKIAKVDAGGWDQIMSSKGIEPFTAINQFFYREPPLPIGSPTLSFLSIFKAYNKIRL